MTEDPKVNELMRRAIEFARTPHDSPKLKEIMAGMRPLVDGLDHASVFRVFEGNMARIASGMFSNGRDRDVSHVRAIVSSYAKDTPAAAGRRFEVVRKLLQSNEAEPFGSAAKEDAAGGTLERVLGEHLRKILENVTPLFEADGLGAPEQDGMLSWNYVLAAHVEGIGGEASKEYAANIREKGRERLTKYHVGEIDRVEVWKNWLLLDDEKTAPKVVQKLALVLWRDIVGPEIARDISRALAHVRAPTSVISSMDSGRRTGGKLTVAPVLPVWVEPPKGLTLCLDFDAKVMTKNDRGMVPLRQILSGHRQIIYLATWASWMDNGMDQNGRFLFDENEFLGEYLGAKRIARTDQKGTRFPAKRRLDLREAFSDLRKISVKTAGDIEAAHVEPLIQEYSLISTGKHLWFRHAPILMDAFREHTIQYPKAVLRQDWRDAPLSMGVAMVIREKAIFMLKGSRKHDAPLEWWLERAGEDTKEGRRKDGLAYFTKARRRLAEAVEDGEVGAFSGGDKPDSLLTLTPDGRLLDAYKPLLDAQAQKIKVGTQAEIHRRIKAKRG